MIEDAFWEVGLLLEGAFTIKGVDQEAQRRMLEADTGGRPKRRTYTSRTHRMASG